MNYFVYQFILFIKQNDVCLLNIQLNKLNNDWVRIWL